MSEDEELQDPEQAAGGGARHSWFTPLAIALTTAAQCFEAVGEGLRMGATALMEHDMWREDQRAAREINDSISVLEE